MSANTTKTGNPVNDKSEEISQQKTDTFAQADTEIQTERQAHYFSRPSLGKGGPSKLRQQFSRGMTFFLVIAASIIFYFAI